MRPALFDLPPPGRIARAQPALGVVMPTCEVDTVVAVMHADSVTSIHSRSLRSCPALTW